MQITDENDPLKPRTEFPVNQIDPQTGEVINDLTIGEYDILVSSAPARDNFHDMQFAQALSLRQAGVMIPDDMIVEYSHLHRKGELAKMIRQISGRELNPEQQQIKQLQTQLAMQNAQLEVAKLEAEVAKLQAEAQYKSAQARSEGAAPEMELQKMQADLQRRQQELATRVEMSKMARENSMAQSELSAATKMAQEAIKNQGNTGLGND